ncbi:sigma-54-dependent transcriptional regulator [Oceaniglobus trochenteri]|uniref:sigma-54-dependent transcriptional regulator n=1 Tax=Oceaniglobus trochenteri TaxID=2763260 RepID=UPI001CFF7312|nr:sigma-54 dependent transcriptional regulator [Oceaniglobus trochenteri]
MTPPIRIMVIDDDREMRASLADLLESAGHVVQAHGGGREALRALAGFAADVMVSDVRMPGMTGLELLDQVQRQGGPPVILISAHGDIPMAVQAMRDGAYTFLEKPFDPRRLLAAVNNAAEQHRLRGETARLKARLLDLSGLGRVLIGDSAAIRTLRDAIVNLADTPATVLVQGETGTGKELVARALHDLSRRAARPFVALSCAAIAPARFEETLFGGDAGAGVLAGAEGGTLFLDEVAAIPPDMQAKLLRLLEAREYLPHGASAPRQADLRLISASHEDLGAAVSAGRMRQDFYHRLNAVPLHLPALRDRPDDIALLFRHFTEQMAALYETTAPEPSAGDLAALLAHGWPGNVRELRNVAERRILAARHGAGSVAEALQATGEPTADLPLRDAVASLERQLIARALTAHQGRMDDVAEALGIGRRTLNEKIVKLGLDKDALV